MSEKEPLLLMTPGPTRVPDRVLRRSARPIIHHRTAEFSAELAEMLQLLGPLFGTVGHVLPVHTTGRGAMEGGICNLFSPGDQIAMCSNGKFGEMWAKIAESYGLVVHRIAKDWTKAVAPFEVEQILGRNPNIRGVAVAYCDTSTGVANDIEAVCRAAHAHNALVLVDAVSALGGMPFAFDEWGVDFAVTASQKCLMSSPGLAFVALSERAWSATRRARLPRNYWDFDDIKREVTRSRPETPGTPPIQIVLQVAEALRMIHEEGLENVFRRHTQMAERTRAGISALGLAVQCPSLRRYSTTLTAVSVSRGSPLTPPVGSPAEAAEVRRIRDGMEARGVLIAAALGQFKDVGFRIGHMGDIRIADVERTLAALAEVLGRSA
jgi:aspartate aminotransferase-like enzyme